MAISLVTCYTIVSLTTYIALLTFEVSHLYHSFSNPLYIPLSFTFKIQLDVAYHRCTVLTSNMHQPLQ